MLSAIHHATFDPITKNLFFFFIADTKKKLLIEELSFISNRREKRAVCLHKE